MEEFVEIVEEIVLEPMTTVNEEEIHDKSVEAMVQVKEGRKRKIGDEGGKEQSSEEEIEEFLSDEAFELMEKKILHKGFICE